MITIITRCPQVINITDKIREEHKDYNFTNLNCGFCEFDVRILLKSAAAPDVEHMWSKPGIIKFRTASSGKCTSNQHENPPFITFCHVCEQNNHNYFIT